MSETKTVWHRYPDEKPKKDDEYLVSVKMWNKSFILLLLGLLQMMFSKIFGTNVYMPGQRNQSHIRKVTHEEQKIIEAISGPKIKKSKDRAVDDGYGGLYGKI